MSVIFSQISLDGEAFVARQVRRQFNRVDQQNDLYRRLLPCSSAMEFLKGKDFVLMVAEELKGK